MTLVAAASSRSGSANLRLEATATNSHEFNISDVAPSLEHGNL